jgi:hypothetical protein
MKRLRGRRRYRFGLAGTSTGTSGGSRRRKALPVLNCVMGPVARQAGGHRFESRIANLNVCAQLHPVVFFGISRGIRILLPSVTACVAATLYGLAMAGSGTLRPVACPNPPPRLVAASTKARGDLRARNEQQCFRNQSKEGCLLPSRYPTSFVDLCILASITRMAIAVIASLGMVIIASDEHRKDLLPLSTESVSTATSHPTRVAPRK